MTTVRTHSSRFDALTPAGGAEPPTRVGVRPHPSRFDALERATGAVPPSHVGVRLLSSRNGANPTLRAGSLAKFDTRQTAAAAALARGDVRQAALADSPARLDYLKDLVRADAPARFDARQVAFADLAARSSARQAALADLAARLDYLKDPVRQASAARLDARQATAADVAARFDYVKTPLTMTVVARHDSRQPMSATSPARFDIWAMQYAAAAARFNALAPVFAASVARYDARGPLAAGPAAAARYDAMTRPGWHVYARDTATGAETFLGFIDQDASPAVLTDVPLADGTWELEARPSEFFWDECRTRQVTTVIITGGVVEASGLPVIIDLRREIKSGLSMIRWRIAGSYALSDFTFGLWYGSTSPVNTTGAPAETMPYFVDRGDYLVVHAQTVSEWVAVAAFTPTAQGPVTELEMPWDAGPPVSPPDQHADYP